MKLKKSLENEASVIIVTYNHAKYIRRCILSVIQNSNPREIIIIDNNSQDMTVKIVANLSKKYPIIRLFRNKNNIGYGSANNLGVKHAKGKYIVILNPDTYVTSNWLYELLKPLEHSNRLVTTPKIFTFNGRLNTCGNNDHFTGLTFVRGWGEDSKKFKKKEFLSGISGACFAMKRKDYLDLGGFDENFFVYMDDTEFSWRLHVTNYKILFVPTSIIYHDYVVNVPPQKIYYLERGRYIILKKYFDTKWLLFFLPSLLFTEILTFGYSLLKGRKGISFKLRAINDGLRIKVNRIRCSRKSLVRKLSWKIPERQLSYGIADAIKRMANLVFFVNYFLMVM